MNNFLNALLFQHYHEQEHDYNEGETIIHQKSQKSQTPKKNNEEYDDGKFFVLL